MSYSDAYDPLEGIAIVGMAGRFPGRANVDEFWQNLLARRETISHFARRRARARATPRTWRARSSPTTCARAASSTDVEMFDAGSSASRPKEAEVIDPQQRLFLETAWEALEHAGYDPQTLRRARSACSRARRNNTYLPAEPARRAATSPIASAR